MNVLLRALRELRVKMFKLFFRSRDSLPQYYLAPLHAVKKPHCTS